MSALPWRRCYFTPSLHSTTSCSTRMAPRWQCECVMACRRSFLCSNTQTQSSLLSPPTACRSCPMPTRRVRCVCLFWMASYFFSSTRLESALCLQMPETLEGSSMFLFHSYQWILLAYIFWWCHVEHWLTPTLSTAACWCINGILPDSLDQSCISMCYSLHYSFMNYIPLSV